MYNNLPKTLVVGNKYMMKDRSVADEPHRYEEVIFVSYTNSPGVVKVRNFLGEELLIARNWLIEDDDDRIGTAGLR